MSKYEVRIDGARADVYEDGKWMCHADTEDDAQRIAAALNAQAGVVDLTRPPMDWGRSRWFDTCKFLVTFDGETMHPLQLGSVMGGKDVIERMVFEFSGVVSRDDLKELDDAIDDAMRVTNTVAHREVIKEAYGRIRPLLSELSTGDLR